MNSNQIEIEEVTVPEDIFKDEPESTPPPTESEKHAASEVKVETLPIPPIVTTPASEASPVSPGLSPQKEENNEEEEKTNGGDEKSPPITFRGSIKVTFPETAVEWVFLPVETMRKKGWSYPSPIPGVHENHKAEIERIEEYKRLLGLPEILDCIESSVNKLCQDKWRQACEASGKDKSVEEIATLFATIFHEGKTREASTKEGFFKKSMQYQKMAMDEKKANGDKINDKVKELSKLAREYNLRAQELMMKEMEELGMES